MRGRVDSEADVGGSTPREKRNFLSIRFIGVSSHNRKLLGEMAGEGEFDVLHFRYNAAHRGAEIDIFPYLPEETEKRPGTVSFTATRLGV